MWAARRPHVSSTASAAATFDDQGRTQPPGFALLDGGDRCALEQTAAWFERWQDRLEEWWLLTPFQDEMSSCIGALGLHLASRFEAALRSLQVQDSVRIYVYMRMLVLSAPIISTVQEGEGERSKKQREAERSREKQRERGILAGLSCCRKRFHRSVPRTALRHI